MSISDLCDLSTLGLNLLAGLQLNSPAMVCVGAATL